MLLDQRAVVPDAGQRVGLGAQLDGAVRLGVLQRDRDVAGEELDQLELLVAEARLGAEALDAQHALDAGRALRSGATISAPACGPRSAKWAHARVGQLVLDQLRLAGAHDVAAHALCRQRHRRQGTRRRERPGRRSAAVAPSAASWTSTQMLSTWTSVARRSAISSSSVLRVQRRQDRLGDAQQLALVVDLAGERLGLGAQLLGGVGVGHRLRGDRGVDLEQAQVVGAELVQARAWPARSRR